MFHRGTPNSIRENSSELVISVTRGLNVDLYTTVGRYPPNIKPFISGHDFRLPGSSVLVS